MKNTTPIPNNNNNQSNNNHKRLSRILLIMLGLMIVVVVGLAFWQTNGENRVILKPETVVYDDESSPFEIVSYDERSIVLSSNEGIQEGTVLAVGITDATPNGLLCKLGSSEKVNSGWKFSITPAAFTDAIERCDILSTITITDDGNYSVEQEGSEAKDPWITQAYAAEWKKGIGPAFSKEIDGYKAEGCLQLVFNLKIKDGKADCSVYGHVLASCEVDSQPAYTTSLEDSLFKKDLKPVVVEIGILPIVLVPQVHVDALCQATITGARIQAGGYMDLKAGASYTTDGGLKPLIEEDSEDPYFKVGADGDLLTADLESVLTGTFDVFFYGSYGPSISLGLDDNVTFKLQTITQGDDTKGAIQIAGINDPLRGTLSEKVTLPLSGCFKCSENFNIFDGTDFESLKDVEIFNSGDSIVLKEDEQSFGRIYETYQFKLGLGNLESDRVFAVDYPDGWWVEPNADSSSTGGKGFGYVIMDESNHDNWINIMMHTHANYSNIYTFSRYQFSDSLAKSNLAPINTESLNALEPDPFPAFKLSGTTFSVVKAKSHDIRPLDINPPGRESSEGKESPEKLVIVADKFVNTSPTESIDIDPYWAGGTWFPYGQINSNSTSPLYIEVYSSSIDGLDQDKIDEMVAILASFRAY